MCDVSFAFDLLGAATTIQRQCHKVMTIRTRGTGRNRRDLLIASSVRLDGLKAVIVLFRLCLDVLLCRLREVLDELTWRRREVRASITNLTKKTRTGPSRDMSEGRNDAVREKNRVVRYLGAVLDDCKFTL